jgi:RimJ/RimL family protein N-acetyltransferase
MGGHVHLATHHEVGSLLGVPGTMNAVTSPMPPAELFADVFVLRAIEDADWRVERDLSRDPDVVRWTLYPEAMTEAEARARVRRSQRRAGEGVVQRYVIWDGDIAVGTCGLGRLDQPTPDAFYALLPFARGRGAATQSLRGLFRWVGSSGRPGLELTTVTGNAASEAVARRAGFHVHHTYQGEHRGGTTALHTWLRTVDCAIAPSPST